MCDQQQEIEHLRLACHSLCDVNLRYYWRLVTAEDTILAQERELQATCGMLFDLGRLEGGARASEIAVLD